MNKQTKCGPPHPPGMNGPASGCSSSSSEELVSERQMREGGGVLSGERERGERESLARSGVCPPPVSSPRAAMVACLC